MRPPGVRSRSAALVALFIAAALGCSEAIVDPSMCAEPIVSRADAVADASNVLRAFASAKLTGADSAAVRYGVDAARDSFTPASAIAGDSVVVPLLGLEPARTYGAQLVAYGACASTTRVELPTFTTSSLPADLPTYIAEGGAPSPGYVVMAAGKYGFVIDNSGRIVWYHRFPDGPGLNFQAQPSGRYVARPPSPAGVAGTFVEIDPSGRVTRTLGCARDLPARMHDMIALADGSYWLLCDETRILDLSAQGKPSDARVLGTALQHRAANGDLLFEWSPFDHLDVELAVLDPADLAASPINWTHGNSIDLDAEGNLLVSYRNLSEVVKIDVRTGALLWRFGGAHDQFALRIGDSPPFRHQHAVRARGVGWLQLLDNLGNANGSRAELYQLDESLKVVWLRDALRSAAGLVAQIGGTVQSIPPDHTLVSYGNGAGVEEYDGNGSLAWRLSGSTGYVFRAQRIQSLYSPGVGDPR